MLFYERFQELLKKHNATIADISKKTGIPYATVDSIIKKKLKTIYLDNAFKIAYYFGISVDVLKSGDGSFKTIVQLTSEEQNLINLYRILLPMDKARIVERIETLLEISATAENHDENKRRA